MIYKMICKVYDKKKENFLKKKKKYERKLKMIMMRANIISCN